MLGLLFLWPVLLVVAILIKVKMPGGPVLFVQKRVGKNGKLFDCHTSSARCGCNLTQKAQITQKRLFRTRMTRMARMVATTLATTTVVAVKDLVLAVR